MMWALEAPVDDAISRLVLVILAEDTNAVGKNAALTAPEIAKKAPCALRTVRSRLADLEAGGYIRRGDQSIVADIRGDQRPIVYDLAMSGFEPASKIVDGSDDVREMHVVRRAGDARRARGAPRDDERRAPDAPREAPDLVLQPEDLSTNTPSGGAAPARTPAREATPTATRGTRLPADWKPDAELAQWTLDAGMTRDQARRTLEDFRDYWWEKTGKDATKKTWVGTWKRWVREEIRREEERTARRKGRSTPRRPQTLNDVLDDIDATDGYQQDPMVIDGDVIR